MTATTESITIERRLEIAASPETVWTLLTDPEEAVRWMGRTAQFELHPGGTYRVEVLPGSIARGEFVEIDPPRRLVYTWGWEAGVSQVPPGATTIEFELIPQENGTLLRFSHRDLPTDESATSHGHGWDHYLARLAVAATGDDPGPDEWMKSSDA